MATGRLQNYICWDRHVQNEIVKAKQKTKNQSGRVGGLILQS